MKSIELKGNLRTEVGKSANNKLRKQALVPCELYGGKENVHFSLDIKPLKKIIYTPEVYLINLDLEGKKYSAIIQSMQFHPVTDEPLHLDFVEVSDDKKITIKLPISLTGNSVGIRNGGKLRQVKRVLKVKGFVKDMPESLVIDISKLDIGSGFKVGDLSFKNIELIDPQSAMVIGIVSSRISKSMQEGEPGLAEAEGAEAEKAEE